GRRRSAIFGAEKSEAAIAGTSEAGGNQTGRATESGSGSSGRKTISGRSPGRRRPSLLERSYRARFEACPISFLPVLNQATPSSCRNAGPWGQGRRETHVPDARRSGRSELRCESSRNSDRSQLQRHSYPQAQKNLANLYRTR